MKGYKAFNLDMTCRDFQYEIGKEYTHKGYFALGGSGFHFCKTIDDCFKYYGKYNCIICEVESPDYALTKGDKCCTNKIKIGKVVFDSRDYYKTLGYSDDLYYADKIGLIEAGRFLDKFKDDKSAIVRKTVAEQGKFLDEFRDDDNGRVRKTANHYLRIKQYIIE